MSSTGQPLPSNPWTQGTTPPPTSLPWDFQRPQEADWPAKMDPLPIQEPAAGEHNWDVYAQSFVPEELRAINMQQATIFPTAPTRSVAYDTYASDFLPPLFSQRRPSLDDLARRRKMHEHKQLQRPQRVVAETYSLHFGDALEHEVQALAENIATQSLFNVHLQVFQQLPGVCYCILGVPGLRENILRIELDDVVSLRQLTMHGMWNASPVIGFTGVQYNARIWLIDRINENVTLRIDHANTFLHNNTLFNVCFQVQPHRVEAQQTALAMVQESLDMSAKLTEDIKTSNATLSASSTPTNGEVDYDTREWIRKMLFPEPSDGVLQLQLTRIAERKLFDKQLNYEQLKAVNSVCKHDYGEVPFLISGPPGTGKTKSIVECALQLVLNDPRISHLLLCAPSDPAADTLAQRLRPHMEFGEFIRLNSPTRTFAEVPEELMAHCFIENNQFYLPPFRQLMGYKVVVTTCRDAAMLVSARVTNKDLFGLEEGMMTSLHGEQSTGKIALHWGALLMDEAAQATEPEASIPLSIVAPPERTEAILSNPIFVMAGDQMQLGPRARTAALKASLFERLFKRSLYKDHPLARDMMRPGGAPSRPLDKTMLPITRPPFSNLVRNYRSHPAILAVPSALFYHDTLIPEASSTDALHAWSGWQGRRWPVLFASNTGPDEIEREGGGWYNMAEARKACNYALSLVQSGLVCEQEICIMSPFRAQVRVLRSLIRTQPYGLWGINIGPLEAFQGLESRVVVICTTRTRGRFLEQDYARGLGIVHEHKRFNVSLTRARDGLVVIGNPHLLAEDPCWMAFLSFCRRHRLWTEEECGSMSLGPGPGSDTTSSNIWQSEDGEVGGARPISALETGLVVKEETRQDVTSDYARFMAAGTDEEMWVSGIMAALTLEGDEGDEEGTPSGIMRDFLNGDAGDESNKGTGLK